MKRLFAISKLGWIRNQQSKLQRQKREPPREYIERESHYLWGGRYLLEVFEDARPAGVRLEYRRIVLTEPEGVQPNEGRRCLYIGAIR